MGQSTSSILPSANPNVPYFSLTFQTPDKLTLAMADESIIALTRSAILESVNNSTSTNGNDVDDFLHYESRTEMNSYAFKFRGLPFMRGCGRANSFRSKRMCCRILEKYHESGWRLMLASDLSRAKELTTWFFCRSSDVDEKIDNNENAAATARRNVLCVSTSASDLIRLANGPEAARRLLTQAVRTAYAANGLKSEAVYDAGDYEIQLTESPWLTQDVTTSVRARRLLLEIVRRFEMVGYQFYGNANTKGTSDSLFFISTRSDVNRKSNSPTLPSQGPKLSITNENGSDVRYSYCAISLNYSNCLRIIEAPANVVKSVLRAIVRYWPPKLQHQTVLDDRGAYEFKLRGNPWWATGGVEATAARVFICGLLETMRSIGWEPLTALDVTRRLNDKAVFIFRSSSTTFDNGVEFTKTQLNNRNFAFLLDESSSPEPFWCLSMHEQSTIRLIGAPERLRQALRHTIEQIWPWGVQNESIIAGSKNGYEFKLRGGPWGAEQQNTTALMCYILKTLTDQGCRVTTSADVTGRYVSNNHGGSHSLDVHSWFLTSIASAASKQRESTPTQNGVSNRITQKRRSMPFITRSATAADEFIFFVESHAPSTTPAVEKEEPETTSERKVKGLLQKSRFRPLRKISTINECGTCD